VSVNGPSAYGVAAKVKRTDEEGSEVRHACEKTELKQSAAHCEHFRA
jgi:hypothetical protein